MIGNVPGKGSASFVDIVQGSVVKRFETSSRWGRVTQFRQIQTLNRTNLTTLNPVQAEARIGVFSKSGGWERKGDGMGAALQGSRGAEDTK